MGELVVRVAAAVGVFDDVGQGGQACGVDACDGLLSLCGFAGIGVCMVANTAMGTSGVAAHEAGLVSGLLNASRQCGGSVGLAVLSSLAVAATRKADSADPLGALTAGYRRASVATGALVLAAAVCAALFVPSPGRRSGEITVTRAA